MVDTVYYACRATIVHEKITNNGLFQLGDEISSVMVMMSDPQHLGGIGRGRGRGRGWAADRWGSERPRTSEEQQEIWDESLNAPPFAFPCGTHSATMDGLREKGRACPGMGPFNGGQYNEADGSLSDQSKGGAQTPGGAEAIPSRDHSLSIACIADIDQEAVCMVDVHWIAARQFRNETWGNSDSEFFTNAMPDPDSAIGHWISYDKGKYWYTNWPEKVREFEKDYQEQRQKNIDIRGLVGGTYLNWSADMEQCCLNALALLDISQRQNRGNQLPETDPMNRFPIHLAGFKIEPYLEISEIVEEWWDKSHLFRSVENRFYVQFLHDLSPRLMHLVGWLTPRHKNGEKFSLWHEIGWEIIRYVDSLTHDWFYSAFQLRANFAAWFPDNLEPLPGNDIPMMQCEHTCSDYRANPLPWFSIQGGKHRKQSDEAA